MEVSSNIKLVKPTVDLKQSFLEGLREFQMEGLPWHLELDYETTARDFDAFVHTLLSKTTQRTDILVPATVLWGIYNGEYAGQISIRHELNAALRIFGGHIGYDTRPSFRGRGVATAMLKNALPVAKSLGLTKTLLTCDDTNIASIRVIEKNGGALEKKETISPHNVLKRYYWIVV